MKTVERKAPEVPGARLLNRIGRHIDSVLYTMSGHGGMSLEYVSESIETLSGYRVEEFLEQGRRWVDLVVDADRRRYEQILAKAQSGQICEFEYRIETADGRTLDVLDKIVPSVNESGPVESMDGWIRNITEQRTVWRNLERTQMLLNLGKLSAGIAHEINTPIQFIGDNTRFLFDSFHQINLLLTLYEQLEEQARRGPVCSQMLDHLAKAAQEADLEFLLEEIPQALEQNLEGVQRVATMVRAMRNFSHVDDRRMSSVDLNQVVESSLIVCRNEVKYVADVQAQLDPELPRIIGCQDDMNQVLLNLLINAAHSIEDFLGADSEERGVITVSTKRQCQSVVLEVSDTGTGIAEEIREKIFEPFFSTKAVGRGTGQGLAIVRSIIVDKHKGQLELDSEINRGTTFRITLPIDPEPGE